MSYRPRQQRDLERARRAAAIAARAQGQSAMDLALAHIAAAFDDASVVNVFKLKVERFLRLGPHDAAVRARFGARAKLLSDRSLYAAVTLVERWWRDERKAFQIASALGRGNRLSLEVLSELRLILRIMRFKRMQAEFFPRSPRNWARSPWPKPPNERLPRLRTDFE
jgi:hypothetical protein